MQQHFITIFKTDKTKAAWSMDLTEYRKTSTSPHPTHPPKIIGICILPLPCQGGHMLDNDKMNHLSLFPFREQQREAPGTAWCHA